VIKKLSRTDLPAGYSQLIEMTVSSDERLLATTLFNAKDSRVVLRDLSTGRTVRTLHNETGGEDLTGYVRQLAFSPDGRLLAGVGPPPPPIYLWDVETGSLLKRLPFGKDPETGQPTLLRFLPDGRLLALFTNWMEVVDVTDGKRQSAVLPLMVVRDLAFLPDGQGMLIAGGLQSKGRLRVIDLAGKTLQDYSEGLVEISSVAVSADGRRALTGDVAGTLQLWDLDVLRPTIVVGKTGNETGIRRVRFSPDGRFSATLDWNDKPVTTRLWRLPREAWPAEDKPAGKANTAPKPTTSSSVPPPAASGTK
jgi:WD40 repeat protein